MAALRSVSVPCPACGSAVDVALTATVGEKTEHTVTVNVGVSSEDVARALREIERCYGARVG